MTTGRDDQAELERYMAASEGVRLTRTRTEKEIREECNEAVRREQQQCREDTDAASEGVRKHIAKLRDQLKDHEARLHAELSAASVQRRRECEENCAAHREERAVQLEENAAYISHLAAKAKREYSDRTAGAKRREAEARHRQKMLNAGYTWHPHIEEK